MILGPTSAGLYWFCPIDNDSSKDFGPYTTFEAAERCRDNYNAFAVTAPICHH